MQIHKSFIRLILEYASKNWDGCPVADSENLENVQLEAAGILTGLPRFDCLGTLYITTVRLSRHALYYHGSPV